MNGRHRLRRRGGAASSGIASWVLLACAALLLMGAGLIVLHVRSYLSGSQRRAAQLVTAEQASIKKAQTAPRCVAPPPSRTGRPLRGLLAIPALGLDAPVLEGVADSSLDQGVGHVPTSSWPDQGGTSILAAHDVTFFAHIDRLTRGAAIVFSGACEQWTYRVTSSAIVPAGTPVAQSTGNQLTLVTCYPTNALFYTNQRYLVNASLEAVSRSHPAAPVPQFPAALTYTAPAALMAQGLSLKTNYVPLTGLTVDTGFDRAWSQSDRPLAAAGAAISTLIAVTKTLEQNRPDYWSVLAPHVPFGELAALTGRPLGYTIAAAVRLYGHGDTVTRIDIACGIGANGRSYAFSLSLRPLGGRTVIASVALQ